MSSTEFCNRLNSLVNLFLNQPAQHKSQEQDGNILRQRISSAKQERLQRQEVANMEREAMADKGRKWRLQNELKQKDIARVRQERSVLEHERIETANAHREQLRANDRERNRDEIEKKEEELRLAIERQHELFSRPRTEKAFYIRLPTSFC